MTRTDRLQEMLRLLKEHVPATRSSLDYGNSFELLVATVLSAQTTDNQVNKITKTLFKKYRSIEDYAGVPIEDLQRDLASINFYRTKAKNIRSAARILLERFQGTVPRSLEELVALPGVGRKTANIVLWNGFGITAGIAVDTHVKRLAQRLGMSRHSDPAKVETDLMAITPREDWGNLSRHLIVHGRTVCTARKPLHDRCVLRTLCPSRAI